MGSFDRRALLKALAAGAGAYWLDPLRWLAPHGPYIPGFVRRAMASSHSPKNLILIYCSGGYRSADLCDTYVAVDGLGNRTLSSTLRCEYTAGELVDWGPLVGQAANTHFLPPTVAGIQPTRKDFFKDVELATGQTDWSARMSLVYNVACETAAHEAGKRIALTGYNRNDKTAGSLLFGNLQAATINSWNMGVALPPGTQSPSLFGEPADLKLLFAQSGFGSGNVGGNAQLASIVESALAEHDALFAAKVQGDARYLEWRARYDQAKELVDADFASIFSLSTADIEKFSKPFKQSLGYDPALGYDAELARRFAGTLKVLTDESVNGPGGAPLCQAVAIEAPGFDTHAASQLQQCCQLMTMLGVLMDELESAGKMDDTLIMVMGDFDRTAVYNESEGTDHHPVTTIPIFAGTNVALEPGPIGAPNVDQPTSGSVYRKSVWRSALKALGIEQSVLDVHFVDVEEL